MVGMPNEFGLQGPSADGRPAPTEKILRVGGADAWRAAPEEADFNRRRAFGRRGRRLARKRLERPISIGAEPTADGRPAPTEKHPSCALKDGSSQLNSGRAEANA